MKTKLLIVLGMSLIFTIYIGSIIWVEYVMVCSNTAVTHLQKYSNLFDENTTKETYGILEIGYPFGVHGGNIKECVDFVLEQRESDRK